MPSITRRETLAAASTGLALLAGCTGSETAERRVPDDRAEAIDHEYVHVRDTTGTLPVARRDRPTTTDERSRPRGGSDYVTTADGFDEWTFADTDAGDRLEAFATETDFEDESLFLYATPVDECHEIHLRRVAIDPDDDPQVDFCRSRRPADVACSRETHHVVGFAIRLPISGEGSTGYGTGMSSRCDRPERPPVFDATVTVEEGDE